MAISAAVLGPRGLKAVEEENAQTALETAQRGSAEADTRHSRIPQTPPLSPGWATAVKRSSVSISQPHKQHRRKCRTHCLSDDQQAKSFEKLSEPPGKPEGEHTAPRLLGFPPPRPPSDCRSWAGMFPQDILI